MRFMTAIVLALLLGSAAVAAARDTPVAVGERAPDIVLGDQYGTPLRLAEVLSQHDFIVVAFHVEAFEQGGLAIDTTRTLAALESLAATKK
jgi:hypothetical protein